MSGRTNTWIDWLESKDGQSSIDTGILSHPNNQRFLENRLWHAYTAGMAQQIKDNAPLLAENKKLREALGNIATTSIGNVEYCIAVAKQALNT